MKKLFNVLIGIFSAIILLLSIVFAVIEARLLFSGDWLVYDNAAAGFFKYLFRFILALSCGAYAVFEFINMKKNNKTISHFLFISNIGMVVMTMVMRMARQTHRLLIRKKQRKRLTTEVLTMHGKLLRR